MRLRVRAHLSPYLHTHLRHSGAALSLPPCSSSLEWSDQTRPKDFYPDYNPLLYFTLTHISASVIRTFFRLWARNQISNPINLILHRTQGKSTLDTRCEFQTRVVQVNVCKSTLHIILQTVCTLNYADFKMWEMKS